MLRKSSSRHLCRFAFKDDLENIRDDWITACKQHSLVLPKKAEKELKKRISRAGAKGEKSKFNFSNCSLTDQHVFTLIEVLARAPIIAKLDLRGNPLTSISANALLSLLTGQVIQTQTIPLDSRLLYAFLGEVYIDTRVDIDASTVDNIQVLSHLLKYENARAFVRNEYQQRGSPAIITQRIATEIWSIILQKSDKSTFYKNDVEQMMMLSTQESGTLEYAQMEKIIFRSLEMDKVLVPVTQRDRILIRELIEECKQRLENSGGNGDAIITVVLNTLHKRSQGQDTLEAQQIDHGMIQQDSDSDDDDETIDQQQSHEVIEYDTERFYSNQEPNQSVIAIAHVSQENETAMSSLTDYVASKRDSIRRSLRSASEASDHSTTSHDTALTYRTTGTARNSVNIDAVATALHSLRNANDTYSSELQNPSSHSNHANDVGGSKQDKELHDNLISVRDPSPLTIQQSNQQKSTTFLGGLFHSLTSYSTDNATEANIAGTNQPNHKLLFGRKSKVLSTTTPTNAILHTSTDENVTRPLAKTMVHEGKENRRSIESAVVNDDLKASHQFHHVEFDEEAARDSTLDSKEHPDSSGSIPLDQQGSSKKNRKTPTSATPSTRSNRFVDPRAMSAKIEASRMKLQGSFLASFMPANDGSNASNRSPIISHPENYDNGGRYSTIWDLSNRSFMDASAETIITCASQDPNNIQLAKIQTIILRDNKLTDFSSLQHLTYTCPKLHSLDLGCNQIQSSIPRSCFLHPDHLRRLDLSRNLIDDISNIVIFQCLEYLNISNNQISTIHSLPSKYLIFLDISSNNLASIIDLRVIGLCQHLKVLSIENNPFCETKDLQRWFPSISSSQPINLRTVAHSLIPSLEVFNGQLLPKQMIKMLRDTKDKKSNPKKPASSTSVPYSHPQMTIKKHNQSTKDKQRCFSYRIREEFLMKERIQYENMILSPPVKLSKDRLQNLQHRLSMPTASYDSRLRAYNRPSSYYLHNPIKTTKTWSPDTDQLSAQKRTILRECMKWIESGRDQIQHAIEAFTIALKIASYDETDSAGKSHSDPMSWMIAREELMTNFQKSLQLVGFYPRIIIPNTIDDYISDTNDYNDQELDVVEKCREIIDQMTSFGNILHDLRDYMSSPSLASPTDDEQEKPTLKTSLQTLMETDDGRFIRDYLLIPNDIDYRKILNLPVANDQEPEEENEMKYDDIYANHTRAVEADPFLSLTIDPSHETAVDGSITNSSISFVGEIAAVDASNEELSPRSLLSRGEVDKHVNDVKNRINGRFLNTLIEQMSQNGTPLASSLPEMVNEEGVSALDLVVEDGNNPDRSVSPTVNKADNSSTESHNSAKSRRMSMFFRPSLSIPRKSTSTPNSDQDVDTISQDDELDESKSPSRHAKQSPLTSPKRSPKSPRRITLADTSVEDSLIPRSVTTAVENIEKKMTPKGVASVSMSALSTESTMSARDRIKARMEAIKSQQKSVE